MNYSPVIDTLHRFTQNGFNSGNGSSYLECIFDLLGALLPQIFITKWVSDYSESIVNFFSSRFPLGT